MSLTEIGSKQAPMERTKFFIPPPALQPSSRSSNWELGSEPMVQWKSQYHKTELRRVGSNWKDNCLAVSGYSFRYSASIFSFPAIIKKMVLSPNKMQPSFAQRKIFSSSSQDEEVQSVNSHCIYLWEIVTLPFARSHWLLYSKETFITWVFPSLESKLQR